MRYAILAIGVTILIVMWSGATYVAGHNSGYDTRDLECKAQIGDIESRALEAERQAVAVKEKSRILADRAAEQVASLREQLAKTEQRMKNEIARLASAHRVALNRELTSLLNRQSRNDIEERRVSETSSPTAGTSPQAAATTANRDRYSGGGASERSVANWIVACRTGYDSCRAQLHGLIDYVRTVTE